MELGLHVSDFTWPGGPPTLARRPAAAIAVAAEDAGFTKLSVMDHVWQIRVVGPPEHDMLEAYTDARLPGRAHRSASSCSPGSPRSSTASRACWPRPSPRSTCCPAAGPGSASARRGTRRSRAASGLPFPPHRRALRAARGGAADLPADVERRRRRRTRASTTSSARTLNSPQSLHAPAPADPDRRRRREEDAAAGRPVRPGLQPVRRPGRCRTSSTCCAGTARPSAATTTRSRRPSWCRSTRGRTARRSTSRCSSSCASWPRSASARRTARFPTSPRSRPLEILGERVIPEIAVAVAAVRRR